MKRNSQLIFEKNSWCFDEQSNSGYNNHGGVKSYACSFCKRGFSNAQALGGHMNIHRRDRAKLKLAENHHIVDNSNLVVDNNINDDNIISQPSDISWAKIQSSPRHQIDSCNEINVEELHQYHQGLPFLVEISSLDHQATFEKNEENNLQDSSIFQIELDLELRLGAPDYHQTPTNRRRRNIF
ncbi:hypothetical protein ACFE04_000620 [Oxalis oulophora]